MVRALLSLGVLVALAGLQSGNPSSQERASDDRPELVIQFGHSGWVYWVAFSPDGKNVATASNDGTARIWDVATSKEIRRLEGHTDWVNSAVFSADGKQVLTASADGTIRLWDAATGREERRFAGDWERVYRAAFSEDGNTLVAEHGEQAVSTWDVASGKEISRLKGNSTYLVSFSPNGKTVFTVSEDGTTKFHDAATGEELSRLKADLNRIISAVFSADGKQLATVGTAEEADNSEVLIWDVASGQELMRLQGHEGRVSSAAFLPDGKSLAVESNDKVLILDLAGEKATIRLEGHAGPVLLMAISPDGNTILTAGRDETTRLWNAKTGKETGRLIAESYGVHRAIFSPDGKLVATVSGEEMNQTRDARIWDVATGKEIRRLQGHTDLVASAVFSPDGKAIVTSSGDGTPRIWDVATAKEIMRLEGRSGAVSEVAFSPDGRTIATANADNTAGVWDIVTGREVVRLKGHSLPGEFETGVQSVAFSPDGKNVITTSHDGTARIWNAASGKQIRRIELQGGSLNSAAFSRDGKKIVTTSWNVVQIWNAASGKEIKRLQAHTELVSSAAFSSDGRTIVTADWDAKARIWDATTGEELMRFEGHLGELLSTAHFSRDGKFIVTAGSDRTARIFDAATGNEIKRLDGHAGSVTSAVFSPDGRFVLTAGRDSTARLWDAKSGKELVALVGLSGGGFITLTPDGYYTCSREGFRGVTFALGSRAFPFEQFDLRLNRPDIVLQRLGSQDKELVAAYRNAYEKRLRMMGITEDKLIRSFDLPELYVENRGEVRQLATAKEIALDLHARDPKGRKLERLFVWVNGAPLFGARGMALGRTASEWRGQTRLELSNGANKIQLSVLNDAGVESLQDTLYVSYSGPAQKPEVYVVAIGVSKYRDNAYNLKFADKDAKDVVKLFTMQKGLFGKVHVYTGRALVNEQATAANIRKAREYLQGAKVDDVVIFFLSGHGVLDKEFNYYFGTHDIEFKRPGSNGLLFQDLEALLDGVPARKKLLLMDTCHAGEMDEEDVRAAKSAGAATGVAMKGVKAGRLEGRPNLGLNQSFLLMQELFTDLRRGSGAAVISSSSGMQFSYEAGRWKNGAFTYAVLQGLKDRFADRDHNGAVTVSELRDFVTERVRKLTNGTQSPTARRDNLEFDFRVY